MPYIAANPEAYLGKVIGNGTSVAFVQFCANAPTTGVWQQGISAAKSSLEQIQKGTVIATMVDGHYPGNSFGAHAAIYFGHDSLAVQVIDQRIGEKVAIRNIPLHSFGADPSYDAESYFVVE
jgi:hypothetical protein